MRPPFFLIVCAAFILSACAPSLKGTTLIEDPLPAPPDYSVPVVTQLTMIGQNRFPTFSLDGKSVYFESSHRPSHEKSQIYVTNLSTKRERRLTYNDGESHRVSFSPEKPQILYSSTTDESKERETSQPPAYPLFYKGQFELAALGAELYASEPDGSKIQRLTKKAGYDGEPSNGRAGQIFFTRYAKDDFDIYLKNGSHEINVSQTPGFDGFASPSPNGKKLAWVTLRTKTPQIVVADHNGKKQTIITTRGHNLFPTWTTDSKRIVFASNRLDDDNFEIYSINADGTCLKRLTYMEGVDWMPSLSKDGKQMLFVSFRTGVSHVYMTIFSEPSSCEPEAPAP